MVDYGVRPQLGLVEAAKLASGRLTQFAGRSRRSEMWWWMLLVLVVNFIGSMFISNLMASAVFSIVVMFFGLSVTVRRVQDTGRSGIWVWASYLLGCAYQLLWAFNPLIEDYVEVLQAGDFEAISEFVNANISSFSVLGIVSLLWMVSVLCVFVFTLMDSQPGTNKYGPSPKYSLPMGV